MKPTRTLALAAVGATALLGVTGCDAGSDAGSDGRLAVLASFYPLQYVAAQVGGDLVDVTSLTPPGAEPHDVELSPRQVREVGDSDVLVYLSGFQAAVDDAVAARTPARVVDAAQIPAVAQAMAARGADPTEEGPAAGDAQARLDPHFWLDPTLLAAVAPEVAAMLTEADPANADAYAAGADALVAELTGLDDDFATGLAQCDQSVIVTAHAAFGYLTDRYGLEQVGLSGLDPDAEPSPARLREIRDVVQEKGVTTVFTEALVSPSVAETLADDLGITTAVLDPVESQVDPDVDYRGAMEANLAALRSALGCA